MYSILKFGSFVRGNSDKYSDKDILIVSNNAFRLNELKQIYTDLGWSVSLYTYDKLRHLANRGYLFVKHLIQEGVIIKDDSNELHNILKGYKQKSNYEVECSEAACFLDFIREIPSNSVSYAWFCDNVYVATRNYLIFYFSIENKFIFSYPSLISELYTHKAINIAERDILLDLRVLKSCYRNGIKEIIPSRLYIESLVKLVGKIGLKLKVSISDEPVIFERYEYEKIKTPYKKLRYLELFVKNNFINDKELNYFVSNPQGYANPFNIDQVYKSFLRKLDKKYDILFLNETNNFNSIK